MTRISTLILVFISEVAVSQIVPTGFEIVYPNISVSNFHPQRFKPISVFRSSPVVSPTIISNFISDIKVVGDTIWFGTGKGVARTLDNGLSFQNYFGTAPFGEDDVSGLAIYNNWVIVATAKSEMINGESVPTGTGIKVSSDYGATWTAHPQPTDAPDDDTLLYGNNRIYALPITVPQQNLSYDVLITRKNFASDSLVIWITSWAGELRKSLDYGATFTRVLLPPDDLDSIYPGGTYNFQYNPRDVAPGNDNHKCFSITAENDSTIYVGTAGGINKSTDWGVSWRKYAFNNTGSGTGISGNFVVALAVQRYPGTTVIWGATNAAAQRTGANQFNAVSYTSSSGLTWRNELKDQVVFSHNIGFRDSVVYVASDNGIWRSYFRPSGFQWSKPSIIYDETTRDRLFTSLFYAVNAKADSIWVGSGEALARTVETGSPWTAKWKIFRAYQPIASTEETYAAPNPFSPDDEVVRIFYKTGKNPANITIRIFDFGMNLVRTLLQNAPRSNPDVIWTIWDGKRDDGMQVANGVYFYRIEVDKEVTAWGKILVLQ